MCIEFFQESLLSSFMSLSFQTLKKSHLTIHFLSGGIDFSVFFNNFFFHFSLLYQSMLLGGGKLFVYHPTLLCYSMLLGNNYSTLIHSFDRGFIIYIYSPIPHFRNLLFDHSFLTEGIDLSVFYKTFFYHFSLPYQSMLLGGDGCCMSNFSFVILHCSVPRKNAIPSFTLLGRD